MIGWSISELMNYQFIVASQKDRFEDTLLYKSMCMNVIDFTRVYFYGNNNRSLPEVYNEGIQKCIKNNINYAIFVHDDVFINCFDFNYRLGCSLFKNYDVVGLAGNTQITLKEPVLWHLMTSRENLRGCVAHGKDSTEYMYTSFGPIPSRAMLIDGVFIAVNLKNLPDTVRFDEKIPSKFHFYDLCFSLDCNLAKVKVGVVDIPIIHNSPGLRNMSDEWKQGQKYFLEKYNKYSGKTLTL